MNSKALEHTSWLRILRDIMNRVYHGTLGEEQGPHLKKKQNSDTCINIKQINMKYDHHSRLIENYEKK